MTLVAVSQGENANVDFPFTDKEFRMIADMANARYGLFLQPSKKALVYSRLAKRLRALKLNGFEAYCALLDRPEGVAEQTHLLSALTTNVTHFFREIHHFETLRDVIATKLLVKVQSGSPVRLWSSACSAGQEAYCMAAALVSGAPDIRRHDVKILATDIDPQIVAQAKLATYPADQLDAIPVPWRSKILAPKSSHSNEIAIHAELRQLVSFGELNLIKKWPMQRKFDVIFCRNAAIYFDKQTQAKLWERFSEALCEGGYLMIGHSERLSGPAKPDFQSVGITTYLKRSMSNNALDKQPKENLL